MTDEELIALSVEHPVLTKERDETVIAEERERQFEKELVKKLDNAVDEVEKREKKEDEIPGVDIERKIVEKVEKRIAEDVDVRETVTLRASEEDDDRPVTMPKDRVPEVNKIKAANEQNQDIVIQRKTILSWIDAIDTIRTTAAKHPECHEVEKDADILSEQVGSYIGDKELKPVIKMDSEPFVDEKEKDIPTEIKIKEPTVYITEVEKFKPDKFPVADAEKAPITKAIEEKIKMEEPTPVLNGKEDSLFLDAAIKEEIKNEKPAIKKEEIETAEPLPIAEIEKNEVTELSPIEIMEKKEKDEAVKLPPISDIVREEKIETVELPSISDIAKEEKIEAAEVSPITDIVKKEQIEAKELLPRTDVVIDEKIEIIQPIPTLPTIKKEMEEEIEDLEKMLEVEIKKEKDEEIEEVPLPEEVIPSIELFEKKEEEEIPQIKKEEIPTIAPLLQPTPKIEKEVPEEKRPEMIQINLTIPIAEIKPTEMEVPAIPFDSRLVAQPYLIIAKIKEKELLQTIPAKLPCTECCLQPPTETTKQFEIPQIDIPQIEVVQTEVIQSEVVQTKMQTEIVQNEVEQAKIVQTEVIQSEVVQTKMMQTEIVQHEVEQAKVVQTESVKTEVVQITSQTISTSEPPRIRNTSEYLKPAVLKASRTENAGDRPEITGRKMLWRKRLKDQSTVTTSSTGSQTDKTSHVSHDRVVRDERERARVPTDELLQSIKIAAGIARPDTEREIRTINYGGKSDETGKAACNCCTCGKTPTPPSTKYKLEVQPQIDATPPAAAMLKRMFIRPKIDQPILHDKLCSDCKVKIQSKMLQEKHKKIIKKISHDQESCSYVSLSSESYRAISQKRVIKKRDQGCLAKIPKQKINPIAQKRKDNLQSISEEKSTVEPLSESCICFKLEKTGVEPIKKGNCYCGD
ncbi:hypothetical protein ALC56_00686 [Trachymyrmex septentrionalis]|uniref:Zonadhesin n=2 Tax=Trachymyrmex septentrionalis TaxID=34720 RepID=A0A195FW90_9HYME|nr:hypothetical protein ALC56_00686 [Trachymyrmex septentrionalis]